MEKREKIIKLLEKWVTSREIANKLHCSLSTISEVRKELADNLKCNNKINQQDNKKLKMLEGLSLKNIQELLYHNKLSEKWRVNIVTEEVWHAMIWAIWDTHLWSKHCNYEWLNKYYDECEKRGVKTVVHAWDMVDWFNTYPWQVFELSKHSMTEQIDDVIQNYPRRNWIDTHYILGNHDEQRLKIAGYDISKGIDHIRTDLHCLWFYNARINVNWIEVELHHWGGGNSYSRSYKAQKYLENMNPKDQPNVYLLGHFHSAIYMFYRKIHAFMAGAFQWETLLAKRLKLGNVNWWWIIDVVLDNNWWTKINMEFIKV